MGTVADMSIPGAQPRRLFDIEAVPMLSPHTEHLLLRSACAAAGVAAPLETRIRFVSPLRKYLRGYPQPESDWVYSLEQMRLHHHLSSHLERISPRLDRMFPRSFDECTLLDHHRPALLHATCAQDEDAVFKQILSLCAMAIHRPHPLRTGGMRGVSASGATVPVIFDSHVRARAQLRRIASRLCRPASNWPLVEATQILAFVVNAHAFVDGNGRTGRMLFNFALNRSGTELGIGYVPVYEAAFHARGGYEIRLRQAEIEREWNPLIAFFCELIFVARHGGGYWYEAS